MMTKRCKFAKNLLWFLSLMCNIGPAAVYACAGFSIADDKQRVVLSLLAITAVLLCGINVIFKHHIRSPLWIFVLGIYACLDNIQGLLVTIAICTIIDESIISPLYKRYKEKYIINKELDKRLEDGKK